MIAFMTFIKFVRIIFFFMKTTNSMTEYVRMINRILNDFILKVARQFVDDLRMKGFKTWYNNEKVLPGIRRAIMKQVQNLNKMLVVIERAENIVSKKKF